MSSRALRKLQQQQELEAEKERAKTESAQNDQHGEEDECGDNDQPDYNLPSKGSNSGARAKMPPHRNPFDLVSKGLVRLV